MDLFSLVGCHTLPKSRIHPTQAVRIDLRVLRYATLTLRGLVDRAVLATLWVLFPVFAESEGLRFEAYTKLRAIDGSNDKHEQSNPRDRPSFGLTLGRKVLCHVWS